MEQEESMSIDSNEVRNKIAIKGLCRMEKKKPTFQARALNIAAVNARPADVLCQTCAWRASCDVDELSMILDVKFDVEQLTRPDDRTWNPLFFFWHATRHTPHATRRGAGADFEVRTRVQVRFQTCRQQQ